MSVPKTELIIKTLEDEAKRLVEAEEYEEALEALTILYDFLDPEKDDE